MFFCFETVFPYFLTCYNAKQKIHTEEDVAQNLFLIENQNKNHFKEIR